MRGISIVLLGATMVGCSAVPPAPLRDARQQQAFMRLTGDKVAGPPINCIPSYSQNDMTIIDGHTIAFRIGTGTVNIVNLSDGCSMVGVGGYALKTQSFGQGLCSNDIATVIDPLNNGMTVGSCAIGPIVPYTRPGR
ncbi:MAG: hypothetical protein V4444_08765 [Pseudomonadota bacterium]